MGEENQSVDLAYELVKELSNANKRQEKQNKRCYVISMILLIGLIASNMAWLYVFQSYDYTSTTTTVETTGGGNAYYTEKGDIENGKNHENDNKTD